MKLNKKNKGKGKVHPSPSSSSSPVSLCKDATSALKLLPAAILTLISVLSLEDREVLAYMLFRSIEATSNPSQLLQENSRRRSKRQATATATAHTPPVFDCGCFDCYTSYWFRWDSSPNRELIHQAIEAFEDHLASGEQLSKSGRGKRRQNSAEEVEFREVVDETDQISSVPELVESLLPDHLESPKDVGFPIEETVRDMEHGNELAKENDKLVQLASLEDETTLVGRTAATATGGSHKGLARKVLPDVIGLFNSRLWSLWNPTV